MARARPRKYVVLTFSGKIWSQHLTEYQAKKSRDICNKRHKNKCRAVKIVRGWRKK